MSKWTIRHNGGIYFVGDEKEAIERIKAMIGDVKDIEVDDGSTVDFDTLLDMAKADDVEVYNCYKGCEMGDDYFSIGIVVN